MAPSRLSSFSRAGTPRRHPTTYIARADGTLITVGLRRDRGPPRARFPSARDAGFRRMNEQEEEKQEHETKPAAVREPKEG